MHTRRMTLWGTAILMIFLMALPGSATAEEFNVSTAAQLQVALNAAATNNQADTINIAAGTYLTSDNGGKPFVYKADFSDGNSNDTSTYDGVTNETYPLTVVGAGKGVTIIDGGWSGGTATDGSPGMAIYLKIFRGDNNPTGNGPDRDNIPENYAYENDSAATVSVSGITFQNCSSAGLTDAYGGGTSFYYNYGGLGIETYLADISVSNCEFLNNNNGANTSTESWEDGGGLTAFTFGGNITLTNSTFDGNTCEGNYSYSCENGTGASLRSGRGDNDSDFGNVTVTGCTFTNNGNAAEYAPYEDGGGLAAMAANGNVVISNNVFENNEVYNNGGGVSAMSHGGNVTFTANEVIGNTSADDHGGGANLKSKKGLVTAKNNLFQENVNEDNAGGGLHVFSAKGAVVESNIFRDNEITGTDDPDGAGVQIVMYGEGSTSVQWNTFDGNISPYDGGGLHIFSRATEPLYVSYNSFTSNQAESSGGGAYIVHPWGDVDLLSNYFYGNQALDTGWYEWDPQGGGAFIDVEHSTVNVINNTFDANTTDSGDGGGLAIRLYDDMSQANLYNNIFWDNVADTDVGNDVYIIDLNDESTPADTTGASVVLSNNNFQTAATDPGSVYILSRDDAGTPSVTYSGNTFVDPLFVTAGSFQLETTSTMIDAGNDAAPQLPTFDLMGSSRAASAPVDIGAWEKSGLTITSPDATSIIQTAPSTFPSDLTDVSQVIGFTASGVTGPTATITITFESLPDTFGLYKVFADTTSVEIYPTNLASELGITNVSLTGLVLTFTIEDNSAADSDHSALATITDPIAVAAGTGSVVPGVPEQPIAPPPGETGGSGGCFIDTVAGSFGSVPVSVLLALAATGLCLIRRK